MACVLYGYTTIPLYDTLGPESISYVLNNSSISTLFCSLLSAEQILKTQNIYKLKNVILYEKPDAALEQKIKEKGLNVFLYENLMQSGKVNRLPICSTIKPDDVFTFSYTSGTTGPPKGAMLTHKNLLGALSNFRHSKLVMD